MKGEKAKLIQSQKDLTEALRTSMKGSVVDPLFEFVTPVVNDYFQAVGGKILSLSESHSLVAFANPSAPQEFDKYYEFALSRFQDSPNALVLFIVEDICRKQLQINKNNKNLALYNNQVCAAEEYFEQQKEAYVQLRIRLPQGNNISNFELVLSESARSKSVVNVFG